MPARENFIIYFFQDRDDTRDYISSFSAVYLKPRKCHYIKTLEAAYLIEPIQPLMSHISTAAAPSI